MLRSCLLALGVTIGLGCVLPDVDLTGRDCPCTDGYVCDAATNTCVQGSANGGNGPGPGGGGPGGSAPGPGGSGSGGEPLGGEGGTGAQGGGNCEGGLLDCEDGVPGCETDPDNSVAHCGGCNQPCTPANVSIAICNIGECDYGACNQSFGDCDGDRATGCETDTNTSNDHCGACDVGCNFACNGGSCPKTVFVTSQTFVGGNIGGLAGADTICQNAASSVGLKGTFLAWLSDATGSPSTRFTQSSTPYQLITGAIIADNWADLIDGSLDVPITVSETGGGIPLGNVGCGVGELAVWTNTSSNGAAANIDPAGSCGNWTDQNMGSAWGRGNDPVSWTSWCFGGVCSWVAPLYCFQQ